VKSLVPWLVVWACFYGFTFFVELGENQFGIPQAALPFLFSLNLTLFSYLLYRFVGRPIGSFLDSRREGIAEELRNARRQLEEADRLQVEVGKRLQDVEREVAELKEKAEADGAAEAARIAEQTDKDEARFLNRVEEEISRREAETRVRLAEDTAALTARLARDLLEREMTDEDRQRILEQSLEHMTRLESKG
jgi:F-type H+-transporting ATPase subunit b